MHRLRFRNEDVPARATRRIRLCDEDVHAAAAVETPIPALERGTQQVEAWSLLPSTLRVKFTSELALSPLTYRDYGSIWSQEVEVNPYRGGAPAKEPKRAWLQHEGVECPPEQTHQIRISAEYRRVPVGPVEPLGLGSLSTSC